MWAFEARCNRAPLQYGLDFFNCWCFLLQCGASKNTTRLSRHTGWTQTKSSTTRAPVIWIPAGQACGEGLWRNIAQHYRAAWREKAGLLLLRAYKNVQNFGDPETPPNPSHSPFNTLTLLPGRSEKCSARCWNFISIRAILFNKSMLLRALYLLHRISLKNLVLNNFSSGGCLLKKNGGHRGGDENANFRSMNWMSLTVRTTFNSPIVFTSFKLLCFFHSTVRWIVGLPWAFRTKKAHAGPSASR